MKNISIQVKTTFLKEQSIPAQNRYTYTYTITIKNQSGHPTTLISRHWIITDAQNNTQEVQGLGVVGEQPRLEPGDEYSYTSGVILATETGSMKGSYQMQTDEGHTFTAIIPPFILVPPHAIH